MLGAIGKGIGLRLPERTGTLSLEKVKEMLARKAFDLFESFHRDHRRKGLALAHDNELVVAQRYAVQEISQPFPNFQSAYTLDHVKGLRLMQV